MNVCCCIEISRLICSLIRGLCRVETGFPCWGVFSRQDTKMAAHSCRRHDARRARSPLPYSWSPDFRVCHVVRVGGNKKSRGGLAGSSAYRRGLNMWSSGIMNICVLSFFLWLFRGVSLASLTRQQTYSLSGKWILSNSNASVSLAAEVPGCVHTALQKQGYVQVKSL